MANEDILKTAQNHYDRANSGSRNWSFLYNTSLGIPIILGLCITLLGIFKDTTVFGIASTSVSAVLGAVASTLTALASFGDFKRKRIANRLARSALEILILKIPDAPATDRGSLTDKLEAIEKALDAGVNPPS